jgi:hypothetical protein
MRAGIGDQAMPEHLEVGVDKDGIVWLTFNANNGKSATLSVNAIANSIHGSITQAALEQWIEDRKKESAQPVQG